IGAFGVGKIIHTHSGDEARKMEEKGFFAFGGSTIVLLFEPGRVIMDENLLNHSCRGYETRVPAGQSIGRLL
ncbi:MAG: phosphatidylserine decarboxylase, partial [Lentisphaeria bacterium]